MAKAGIVTGHAEIDAKLASMDAKTQKQLARGALRSSAKLVQADVARTSPRDTGAMSRAYVVRAMKRSRTRIGSSVTITRASLAKGQRATAAAAIRAITKNRLAATLFSIKESYSSQLSDAGLSRDQKSAIRASRSSEIKSARQSAAFDRKRGIRNIETKDKGFYPAFVELGTNDTPAQRPLRASLYGNSKNVIKHFRSDMERLIAHARVR